MTKHPGGRPEKINPDIREKILFALNANCPVAIAAGYARISRSTYYNWYNWGEEDKKAAIESEYSEFFDDVNEAEAKKIMYHLGQVEKRPKGWQANMTILARRWREHFGEDAGVIQTLLEKFMQIEEKVRTMTTAQSTPAGSVLENKVPDNGDV